MSIWQMWKDHPDLHVITEYQGNSCSSRITGVGDLRFIETKVKGSDYEGLSITTGGMGTLIQCFKQLGWCVTPT